MKDKELRELDCWLAEHVFRCQVSDAIPDSYSLPLYVNGEITYSAKPFDWKPFRPTTDPAAAMEVLRAVAKRAKKSICICVYTEGFEVYFGGGDYAKSTVKAETLELAIGIFAKHNITLFPLV